MAGAFVVRKKYLNTVKQSNIIVQVVESLSQKKVCYMDIQIVGIAAAAAGWR